MPSATKISVSVMISGTASTGSPCATAPVTGSSQVVKAFPRARINPSTAEPAARIIIGTVIMSGDSWGCWSSVHRLLPWKVMKKRRDM